MEMMRAARCVVSRVRPLRKRALSTDERPRFGAQDESWRNRFKHLERTVRYNMLVDKHKQLEKSRDKWFLVAIISGTALSFDVGCWFASAHLTKS